MLIWAEMETWQGNILAVMEGDPPIFHFGQV